MRVSPTSRRTTTSNSTRCATHCAEPRTAFELLPSMFRRVPRGFHRLLAIGEAVAHLNYLCAEGILVRLVDASGVARFVVSRPGSVAG